MKRHDLFVKLLTARVADQVTVTEYYERAAALGRTKSQAKQALMTARKTDKSSRLAKRAGLPSLGDAAARYQRWVRKCLEQGIPVSQGFDDYCKELAEVAKVEAAEPKVEPVEIGPSYSYQQYVAPTAKD